MEINFDDKKTDSVIFDNEILMKVTSVKTKEHLKGMFMQRIYILLYC